MNNAANTITEIRANMHTYSDEDMSILRGRLTLNMYGAEVSEALAAEVIAECARRKAAAETETMTYAQHAANEQAAADQWMLEHGAELDAEIQVGDDTGPGMYSARPESDKALMTDALTGQVRLREVLKATETTYKTSELPSGDLSGVDTESLGFYVVTTKQSEMAKRERSTYGIEFTRNVKGQKRGGKTGKTRETKAEKMARLAKRYNK